MTEKTPNYTDEMVARLVEQYEAEPTRETVNELAVELGKSPRSVIAKLCTLGIYQTPPRTTKNGKPIVKKEEMVAEICESLGVEIPSLVKTNKRDLETLVKAIREVV
jgi:hypothetical protein